MQLKRLIGWTSFLARASRLWRLLLVCLVAIVTFLALAPTPPAHVSIGWDKSDHVLAFAALALSGWLGHATTRLSGAAVTATLLGYGGLIEVAQMVIPHRSAEWGDFVADVLGVGCGVLLAGCLRRAARNHGRA